MRGRWWALVAVSLATFMTYLDNNVVNVALPTIQRDLGLSISSLEWIVSAYVLVFAGLLLVGGRLADLLGPRVAFFAGLAVFTLSSVAAGLAGGEVTLISARAAQGLGAALLAPTSLALLPKIFPNPRERATAVGVWSGVGALALAIGPLTGGLLSEHAHWGWVFLINAPIGVVTAVIGTRSIQIGRDPGAHSGLDLPGLVTSALTLFALTFALIEGESRGWTSPLILGSFGLAVLAAAAFVVAESRTARPMIDLSLFRDRVFSGGLLSMGLWAFGVFGIYFYTAIYLQSALGFSPTEAGAGFVPMALLLAVLAVVSPRIAERFGSGPTVAAGLALMAVAIGGLSSAGEGSGYLDLLPWFLVYGAGGGLLVPLTNLVLGAMPPARAGVASGVLNVSREVFGLLGITILGAVLSARQDAVAGPPLHKFLDAYQFTLILAAVIIFVGVPVSLYSLGRRRTPATPPAVSPAVSPATSSGTSSGTSEPAVVEPVA
ncbi:MFS transporter [Microbispora sp. RL4-1S]|uniref:MFS transporter n=1 Tax=Microbispora oryzae TaxID=2806554 RepID=A0A940WMA6_9ACTN|nr:MFS transporter [Microbispora oryzae]MBP2707543.1 MFS transporter [Microbispora oryzae]